MIKKSIKKEKYYDQSDQNFQNMIVIFEYINILLLGV